MNKRIELQFESEVSVYGWRCESCKKVNHLHIHSEDTTPNRAITVTCVKCGAKFDVLNPNREIDCFDEKEDFDEEDWINGCDLQKAGEKTIKGKR